MLVPSRETAEKHYAVHAERPFFGELVDFVTSGPVVAMVWEGPAAILLTRNMIGATKPANAVPGTIRGDYSSSRQMNLVHASDSEESAARELALYFQPNELCEYTPTLVGSFRASDES